MRLLMKNPFNYTCLLFRKIWFLGNQLLAELLNYLLLSKLSGLMEQVIISQFWKGLLGNGTRQDQRLHCPSQATSIVSKTTVSCKWTAVTMSNCFEMSWHLSGGNIVFDIPTHPS
uniref:Uncharacterized protein n=1 Tax=Micrurus lemniscatus lemniscatus TaxID=129467 RepID=A0A2D4IMP2_MICLE